MRPANLVPAFCISVAVLVAEACPSPAPDPAPSLSGKTPVNVIEASHNNAVCVVGTDCQGYRHRGSGLCILTSVVCICAPVR